MFWFGCSCLTYAVYIGTAADCKVSLTSSASLRHNDKTPLIPVNL